MHILLSNSTRESIANLGSDYKGSFEYVIGARHNKQETEQWIPSVNSPITIPTNPQMEAWHVVDAT